jgi:hypothetical protein
MRSKTRPIGAKNASPGSDCRQPATNTKVLPGGPDNRHHVPQIGVHPGVPI